LSARRVIDRLCIELRHHGGRQSSRLCVTYEDFVNYGIGNRHCITPAIREVVALGFVEITQQGRGGNAEFRQPTHYRLTFINNIDGEPPTDEWRRIRTLEQARTIAGEARKRVSKKKNPVSKSGTDVGVNSRTETASKPVSRTTPLSDAKMTPLSHISGRVDGRRSAADVASHIRVVDQRTTMNNARFESEPRTNSMEYGRGPGTMELNTVTKPRERLRPSDYDNED